jgi:hypothetical protein
MVCMKPPRIVTARPPKHRAEPDGPKPQPAAAIVHSSRSKRAPKEVETTPEDAAAVKAFFKRMIRPPGG